MKRVEASICLKSQYVTVMPKYVEWKKVELYTAQCELRIQYKRTSEAKMIMPGDLS